MNTMTDDFNSKSIQELIPFIQYVQENNTDILNSGDTIESDSLAKAIEMYNDKHYHGACRSFKCFNHPSLQQTVKEH